MMLVCLSCWVSHFAAVVSNSSWGVWDYANPSTMPPNRARAKLKVDDRKATPKGAADKNINIDESPAALQHAEGELSFAQFVQLLGPTFVINKKLTPSQRRAQQLLEQLQRR